MRPRRERLGCRPRLLALLAGLLRFNEAEARTPRMQAQRR